jgi:hypothetical protein
MSDARPLPSRPNLEQYKKQAKELQRSQQCSLAGAQFSLARRHGFASWPKFAAHVKELARAQSAVSQFESAVDAIVSGDTAALAKLLRDHPGLVHERSTREHRSTLLHYVSANGVEDFRQKTPPNIVAIAQMLLDAGADVNAESDAYRGRQTTLGLTATSVHPERSGAQLPLLQLLIARGASVDGPDGAGTVNACLHNGRGAAAEYLAAHGARLDLEGAAGVGQLDLVQSFFAEDGSLMPPATAAQLVEGFAWACEFGRGNVVEFLLKRGANPAAKVPLHGSTGLHWAAHGGHADTVRLLLERGAPLDVTDTSFGASPLEWALHAWDEASDPEPFYEVVAILARAGARLNWKQYESPRGQRAAEKIRADPRMMAALRGETPAG